MASLQGRKVDELCKSQINFHISTNQFQPSIFSIFGYVGLVFAIVFSLRMISIMRLVFWVQILIILTAILVFLGLALITNIISSRSRLIYYHQFTAVICVVLLLLRGLKQPVLPYLDIATLGIGLFTAWGRIGCFLVGCCYGRPDAWGIRYRRKHASIGFPYCLVGVRLLPIQAIESLWLFSLVAVGTILVLTHQPAGAAFTWYVVAYGVGRFNFEFFRGDADRPYYWHFSQAQWISFILIAGIVISAYSNLLPWYLWQNLALLLLVLEVIAVIISRRLDQTKTYRLLHPHHVREVAEAIQFTSQLTAGMSSISSVAVRSTSLGIQISTNRIQTSEGGIKQYTFSSNREIPRAKARVLAKLIWRLTPDATTYELIEARTGIFHLLVRLNS